MTTTEFRESSLAGIFGSSTYRRKITRDGENSKEEFAFVRGGPRSRYVFIAVLPGTFDLYSGIWGHYGTPMFNNIIQPGARYPGLTSRDDIHANRQWVLKVMQGNIQVPTIEDLGHDGYFRCPRESESIMIEKFEAWQMIGVTNMTNDEISLNATELWRNWRPCDHDPRIWNSQNFVLYLAMLILQQDGQEDRFDALRYLRGHLYHKQHERFNSLMLRRHGIAMGGMALLGPLLGPVGPIGSWMYAGYGIFDGGRADELFRERDRQLLNHFGILRNVLNINQAE